MSIKSLLAIGLDGLSEGEIVPTLPAAIEPTVSPTQTPEEALALARRVGFLASTRPGFDYGLRSNNRNALYGNDIGLGFDVLGTIFASVKKSAPAAFSGVKVPLPQFKSAAALGLGLPSWAPKISVPVPLQNALKSVATKAAADLRAAKAASSVAASQSGDLGFPAPQSSANKNMTWILGGAAILAVAAFLKRRK